MIQKVISGKKRNKIKPIFGWFTMYSCRKGYTMQFEAVQEKSVLGADTGFSEKGRE